MYQFTFEKGSSFWFWRVAPFSYVTYHLSSRLGEVDKDALSTLSHTFLILFFLDCVVEGSSGWGSGEPRNVALSCTEIWKICCRPRCGIGFLLFQHQSLPWRLPGRVIQELALCPGPPPCWWRRGFPIFRQVLDNSRCRRSATHRSGFRS